MAATKKITSLHLPESLSITRKGSRTLKDMVEDLITLQFRKSAGAFATYFDTVDVVSDIVLPCLNAYTLPPRKQKGKDKRKR